jgi:hypothetical protein
MAPTQKPEEPNFQTFERFSIQGSLSPFDRLRASGILKKILQGCHDVRRLEGMAEGGGVAGHLQIAHA